MVIGTGVFNIIYIKILHELHKNGYTVNKCTDDNL